MFYDENFAIRANRDARFRELKAQGVRDIRRGSMRNQLLSPDYVEDFAQTGRTASPNGFGGSSPTFFAVIYTIDRDR